LKPAKEKDGRRILNLELRKEREKRVVSRQKERKKKRHKKAKKKQNDKRIARVVHGLNIANSIRMANAVTSNQTSPILTEWSCNSKGSPREIVGLEQHLNLISAKRRRPPSMQCVCCYPRQTLSK